MAAKRVVRRKPPTQLQKVERQRAQLEPKLKTKKAEAKDLKDRAALATLPTPKPKAKRGLIGDIGHAVESAADEVGKVVKTAYGRPDTKLPTDAELKKKYPKKPKPSASYLARFEPGGEEYRGDPKKVTRAAVRKYLRTLDSDASKVAGPPKPEPAGPPLPAKIAERRYRKWETEYVKAQREAAKPDPKKDGRYKGGPGGFVSPGMPGVQTGAKIAAIQTKAAVTHPAKTAKGLSEQVTGLVGTAGEVGLPLLDAAGHTITGRPERAVKDAKKSARAVGRLGKQVVKSTEEHYGPAIRGDWKGFEKNANKDPARVTDLLIAGGVTAKLARPATRAIVKAVPGRKGGGKAFLEAPRPKLRVSGGKAVDQTVSHKPTRVAIQRAEDKLRVRKTKKVEAKRQVAAQRAIEGEDVEAIGSRDRAPALQPVKSPVVKSIERHNAKRGTQVPLPRAETEVVALSPKLAARRQRVEVSKQSAKAYIGVKHEGAEEIGRGANKALATLSRKQRRATYHVLKGIVPADASPKVARKFIEERQAQIADAPKGVPVLRKNTERATLSYLHKHADEIFGDGRLEQFRAGEVERGKRVLTDDAGQHTPALRPSTAAKQRVRAQGEFLGVEYKPPAKDATPEVVDAYHDTYAKAVARAAEAKGLPEPTYFPDQERPSIQVSARTGSNVARASKGSKRSKMKLFREGRAVTNPEVYVQGIAKTIKPKHQWKAVADVADEHAFPWSRGSKGEGKTVAELEREIDRRGLKREDVVFYSPGQLRRAADGEDEALAEIVHAPGSSNLVRDERYVAVPAGAGRELQGMATPSSAGWRRIARLQGFQSSIILGLNPTWAMMQVAANTLQSTIGTGGRIDRVVRAQGWYRKLDAADRKLVDNMINVGLFEGTSGAPHMGSHQGAIGRSVESMGQIPVVRTKNGTLRITDADPRKLMFRFDNRQNAVFRRGVFLNEVYKSQKALARLSARLKGDAPTQLSNVLKDPRVVEQAAQHVDNVLGDYLRYTNRERKLKAGVMFYGFLRYATKTLFYTLPKDHPLTLALGLKLGQLHNEDIRAIFGTRDLPPWVFSRSYEYDDNGKLRRDAQGRPMYRDLARINPVSGPITEAVTEGPKAVAGLMSPLAQSAFNIVANKNVGAGRPLQVKGSAQQQRSIDAVTGARVAGKSIVSSTLPGRIGLGVISGGKTMGDDFSTIKYKTEDARARDAQRQRDRPSLKQTLSPLTVARADTTQDFLNRHGQGQDRAVNAKIKKIDEKIAALPRDKAGRIKGDEYGYKTKGHQELLRQKAVLRAEKAKILGKKKVKPLKARPLSPAEQADAQVKRLVKQAKDPAKSVQDEINRLLEGAKVAGGG